MVFSGYSSLLHSVHVLYACMLYEDAFDAHTNALYYRHFRLDQLMYCSWQVIFTIVSKFKHHILLLIIPFFSL